MNNNENKILVLSYMRSGCDFWNCIGTKSWNTTQKGWPMTNMNKHITQKIINYEVYDCISPPWLHVSHLMNVFCFLCKITFMQVCSKFHRKCRKDSKRNKTSQSSPISWQIWMLWSILRHKPIIIITCRIAFSLLFFAPSRFSSLTHLFTHIHVHTVFIYHYS